MSGSPNPFRSGQPLTVTIQVNGGGCFLAQNINGLAQSYEVTPTCIPSGQIGTITLQFVTGGTQSGSGTVSGDVVDVGTGQSSHFQVDYKMEAPSQCSDGKTYWAGGNKIQTCKNGVLIDQQYCDFGVTGDG